MATVPRPPDVLHQSRTLLLLLCTLHFLAFFDRFLLSGALSFVKADFSLSDTRLGLLEGTLFAVAYAITVLCSGRIADTRFRRPFIAAGLIIWGLAALSCAFTTSFTGFAAGQFFIGVGQAACIPAALSLVASLGPNRGTAKRVSFFTAGSTLGRSMSVLLAGILMGAVAGSHLLAMLHLNAPWRALYLFSALPNFLLLLALVVVFRTAAPGARRPAMRDSSARAWVRRNGAAYLSCILAVLPTILLIQSVAAWFPTLCARGFGMNPARAAIYVGAVTLLTSPTGQLLGGRLVDRYPAMRQAPSAVVMLGIGIACGACFLAYVADSLFLTLAALALINLLLGVASLAALAGIQIVTPHDLRGRINGWFISLLTLIGVGVGPLMVGMISDSAYELPAALLIVAVGAFLVSVAGHRLYGDAIGPIAARLHSDTAVGHAS